MKKRKTPRVPPPVGTGKRGPDGHIGYLLRQAQAAVRLAHDVKLAEAGLTTPQFLVLNLLDAYRGASGAELARSAQLTPQTINLIVRKLEREGLIARDEHETHGRVLRLTLTALGKERLRQGKILSDKIERRILALAEQDTERKVRRWLVDVAVALMGG
jgi:DNA-binding MarR family transcriptional regulator